MRSRDKGSAAQMRRRIAIEAARLIAEQGLRDFQAAKRKAVVRLGLGESAPMPRNSEIDEALREHQQLFQADTQPVELGLRRAAAVEAMQFFARFQPRLVGAALEGTADAWSAVCLHLFCDNLAEVLLFLDDHGIPFEQQERSLRLSSDTSAEFPVLLFAAGGVDIDLTVFPLDGLRHAPLDRISERPIRRATLDNLLALMQ